jgi:D-3-phosphoglycerate dehydrogenase / 2-oxoglutarate reductase
MDHLSVAITIRSFNETGPAMERLKTEFAVVYYNNSGSRLSEDDLISAVKNAECVIAGTEIFNQRVLESAPHLKIISRVGVGVDNIDLKYAKKLGIAIVNTPKTPIDAVAEHTIALIFSVMKHIPQYYNRIHNGDYSIQSGTLIAGKTIGIIGLGRIGKKVGILADALGLTISFYDPWIQDSFPNNWLRKDSLDDLLYDADIISLHTPPQAENYPLLDKNTFSLCKRGVVIINTARGSLIDEQALIHALDNGIVSSAGLDVVSSEPYKGPLLEYPQVVITPHIASNTAESRQQMEIEAVENMLNTFRI